MFFLFFLALIIPKEKYLVKYHNTTKKHYPPPEGAQTFVTYKDNSSYLCFKSDGPAYPGYTNIEHASERIKKALEGRCASFKFGFTHFFKLCHFNNVTLKTQLKRNSTDANITHIIGQTQGPLIFNQTVFQQKWEGNYTDFLNTSIIKNATTVVEYYCDPSLYQSNIIETVFINDYNSSIEFRIRFGVGVICYIQNIIKFNYDTIHCINQVAIDNINETNRTEEL
ncbi:hypothetical protein M9Y10_044112 [Tritrichomonas musculus]|uniref:Uncharacterized protein n=1 Tax=Tritrichomonas musculus TaxID=1915356 RepID=A0ABR2K1J5_9EUKA